MLQGKPGLIASGLALVLLMVSTQPASAQLAIMARRDKTEVLVIVNEQGPLKKAKALAAKREGDWFVLTNSDACGYASVFAVADKDRYERRYFVSIGLPTAAEAIRYAREQAAAYARSVKDTPFIVKAGIKVTAERPALEANARSVAEHLAGADPCTRSRDKGKAVGVRG